MYDTFGFPRGARRLGNSVNIIQDDGVQISHIKNEQRVLGCHNFGRAVVRYLEHLLVPPLVPAFRPGNLIPSSLENDDMLNEGAILQSSVDDGLCSDGFTTAFTLIGRDDDSRFAVLYTIAKRLGREPGKHDGMNRPDTRASEEGRYSVPSHREVHRDGVALLDAESLEHIGDAAHLAQKLCIGDQEALAGLISLVDDGRLTSNN